MNLVEHVKEIEKKYHAGQNLFRRQSVGFLLERISQLEQSAQQGVEPTVSKQGVFPRETIWNGRGVRPD